MEHYGGVMGLKFKASFIRYVMEELWDVRGYYDAVMGHYGGLWGSYEQLCVVIGCYMTCMGPL